MAVDDGLPPLPVFAPRAPVEEDPNPLQRPGVDEHRNRTVIGGPTSAQDIRFIVSVPILEDLLESARGSSTRRVVVFGVGFKVATYTDGTGHLFQVFTLIGKKPVPEVPAILVPLLGPTVPKDEIFKEPSLTHPAAKDWTLRSEKVIGGPDQDLRLLLSVEILEAMLDRAGASRTRRAVIHRAGLVVDTYVPVAGGAPYQIVTVMGLKPVPEDPAIIAP